MAPFPSDLWAQYTKSSPSIAPVSQKSVAKSVKDDEGEMVQVPGDKQYWQLYCNGRTLNYAIKAFGTQPSTGYPLYICFHGGGTNSDEPENYNDSDWWSVFDTFYGQPVSKQSPCVFVAARGVSAYAGDSYDTYDLHSQPESFVLLQRMIMNLMLPKPTEFASATLTSNSFIDPNKVYLLGFSAGGNGVFQLCTKMSDRCAAAVAGSGHPEGAKFENLANLPLRIQVGGNDTWTWPQGVTHKRPAPNLAADATLSGLQTYYKDQSLYQHKIDIVQGGDHNTWAQPGQVDNGQLVFTKPQDYYINQVWDPTASTTTNAPSTVINPEKWAAGYTRSPIPSTVIWRLDSRPPELGAKGPIKAPDGKDVPYQAQTLFYWLCIRDATSSDYSATDIIHASWGKDTTKNWIRIEKPVGYLGFLINADMANFSKPMIVYDWNNTQLGSVSLGTQSSTLMMETLKARGDPTMVFSKMVYLQNAGAGAAQWTVKTADSLSPSAVPPK